MAWVLDLQLAHYRCYEQAKLSGLGAGAVVLHGENGAGKTNILEAVSYLVPGRGMRGAKVLDLQRRDSDVLPWSVSAKIESFFGEVRIGTGRDPLKDSRVVRINGESAKAQTALAEYLSYVWLTPQMDRLFLDASASRRRFLDRLIFAFDAGHSGRVNRYENALRQRSKLLQQERADPAWLAGLEDNLAQTGVAIAAARLDFVQRLQRACDESDVGGYFPSARLRASGTIEELLQHSKALEVEDMFRYQLSETRGQDAITGGAATGPHKSDLIVEYAEKMMPAEQCSTGEQKALLIGIILAHSRLIKAEKDAPPVLLLDEVAAHLDDQRRSALHEILLEIGGQVWLTGTDETLFADLRQKGKFFHVRNSTLNEDVSVHAVAS